VLLRLLAALLTGSAVAWIYRRTTKNPEATATLPVTLTLLAVLIAMVTQVIGDNVARAFSLVGALSIVRFRTVVRDTRDTAFVIFAVVMGMAAGSDNLWVAVIGLVVVGGAAFLMARQDMGIVEELPPLALILTARLALGYDPEQALSAPLNAYLAERRLLSVSTVKQGASLQVIYEASLRQDGSAVELVSAINQIDGVQDVRLQRRGFEPE
jgi:hypothetical protein